jgi:hypothetical protein
MQILFHFSFLFTQWVGFGAVVDSQTVTLTVGVGLLTDQWQLRELK